MQKLPYLIYAEMTPNPATMKFVANRNIDESGRVFQFDSAEAATGAPLAQRLFTFPFVKSVFFTQNFITISKHEGIEWNEVTMELREYIAGYLNAGYAVIEADAIGEQAATTAVATDHRNPETPAEQRIVEILDEYVRPAVEGDGGAIHFDSFSDGRLHLVLKGACSGCPSSSQTLKAGIQSLFERMMPEVREVVAVEG